MKKIGDMDKFLFSSSQTLIEMVDRIDNSNDLSLSELNKDKTLIVSIDMNKGFAKSGSLYSSRIEELIPDTARFLNHCIDNDYNVVAFSDKHTQNSPEISNFPQHCMENSEEYELVEELSALKDKAIDKNSTNAFFAQSSNVNYEDYDNVIITGCCTDICVYQLATTLVGFYNEKNIKSRVIVVIELVDTYDAPWHCAEFLNYVSLDSMIQNGVEVVKSINY